VEKRILRRQPRLNGLAILTLTKKLEPKNRQQQWTEVQDAADSHLGFQGLEVAEMIRPRYRFLCAGSLLF
jgi:hypothetical protein